MISSIKFRDISDRIEHAKNEAVESDKKYDLEYEKYIAVKKRMEKEQAEWEKQREAAPEESRKIEYCEWRSPRHLFYDKNLRPRTSPSDWHEFVGAPYENALESLNGHEFTFTGGLNVLVGANGSGKTTLLNVIRKIFFANRKPQSMLNGESLWHLDLKSNVVPMLDVCDMKADYKKCVFNLMDSSDIDDMNIWSCGIGSLMQKYYSYRMSNGESGIYAISRLFTEFAKGVIGDESEESARKRRSMEWSVMCELRNAEARCQDDSTVSNIRKVISYYADHQEDGEKWTMLMDEPDDGLDIYRLGELCSLLERMVDDAPKSRIQPVVVLHNATILSRLMKKGGVNFIELTPGYLEAVRSFAV